eukprot:scaffold35226_cov21-Prasinocladus_malaysianus.AAC.1
MGLDTREARPWPKIDCLVHNEFVSHTYNALTGCINKDPQRVCSSPNKALLAGGDCVVNKALLPLLVSTTYCRNKPIRLNHMLSRRHGLLFGVRGQLGMAARAQTVMRDTYNHQHHHPSSP